MATVNAPSRFRELDSLKRMFRTAADAQSPARALAFRDRDWYDNSDDDQWSAQEKDELKRRGQPPVTANDIKRNVNFVLGWEQRTRTDPRAYPRDPEGEQAADIVTNVLDYIENRVHFDKTATACFKDLAIEGVEAAEVIVEDDQIEAVRIDFQKFFYDPRSREADFSDARYLGYVDWFDIDEAKELFPQSEDMIQETMDSTEEGYDDKPEEWADPARQRVRIAVVYYKRGAKDWAYAYYTGGGVLEEGQTAYRDEDGNPDCPIIAQSCYVDRENNRFGVVRDMISPQREKNWRRSLALYLMKSRRMWAEEQVFEDPAKARQDAAKSDALLIARGRLNENWGFIDNAAEISANFAMMQRAEVDLDRAGPNRALASEGQGATSGRDRALQQNAALTEENTLFDRHSDWKLRVYKAFWARAKQFWTEHRYIRVTKEEDAFEFIQINQPVVAVDPETGMEVPIGVENRLADMDVDIIIDAVQDAATLQHEQFEVFTNSLSMLVQAPPEYTEMLLDMMPNLRNKDELRSKIQEMKEAQSQQAQEAKQLQMMEFQTRIAAEQAKTQRDAAGAAQDAADAIKTQAEAEGEQLENEMRRFTLMQQPWTAEVNASF